MNFVEGQKLLLAAAMVATVSHGFIAPSTVLRSYRNFPPAAAAADTTPKSLVEAFTTQNVRGGSHLCRRTAVAADSSSTAGKEGERADGKRRGYNRVEIEYCTGCRWMLRAAWLSQELLTTFQEELDEVAIMPSRVSGTFDVRCNGVVIWSRKEQGRFPEVKEVKWGCGTWSSRVKGWATRRGRRRIHLRRRVAH